MDRSATLSTNAFAQVAREFCKWCESSIDTTSRDVAGASWLCKLYASALSLSQTEPENEDGLPEIPAEILEQATQGLSAFDGRYYREYFDPDPTLTDESVMGDIGDDLFDIYRDIRRGLLHWGRHAVGAIFALHCMSICKVD
jgi:Domain of unknown function (DUF5063)